jgi:ribosomal RNA-processing protein 9
MSSFFTTPVSQRKRKRFEGGTEPSSKKRNTSGGVSTQENGRERKRRDESISGSESDEEDGVTRRAGSDESQDSSESEIEDETGAERRLRLARRYLDNIKGEVQDEVGFDAAELDKDLIAERLKEDVVGFVLDLVISFLRRL